jgi:predicted dehydrogenase
MRVNVINWAIVGTGDISRQVASDFALVAGAKVVAVVSRSRQRAQDFAEYCGADRGYEMDALLNDEAVDAVYLGTPHATHCALAVRCLEADKHVLVEKPLGVDKAEVRKVEVAAAAAGRFAMEAMWMKFNPAYRQLITEIRAGVIGEVASVRASFGIPFPKDSGSRWSAELRGSTLLDQGIYPVTLALDVLGQPETIHAAGRVRVDGVDLGEHMTLEYAGGRFAQLAASMTEFVDPTASISGTRGWIQVPFPFWATSGYTVWGGPDLFSPRTLSIPMDGNGYPPMLTAACDAIGRGLQEHPVHPWSDIHRVFDVLDRIRNQLIPGSA